MVLNDSGHPLMTGGRVVKRTTSWCFANGQETGTIGVPAVPLLPLFLLILLLLLLVYRPSCANSIRRHCCWLVLLLIYCLLATRAPQVVQIAGLNPFLFERSSLKQIDEESVCFFEIPLTTSLYSLRLPQVPGSSWSPSCGIRHCTFLIWRLKYNSITNGTFSISRRVKHINSINTIKTPVSCRWLTLEVV